MAEPAPLAEYLSGCICPSLKQHNKTEAYERENLHHIIRWQIAGVVGREKWVGTLVEPAYRVPVRDFVPGRAGRRGGGGVFPRPP